ncbi:MAG: hypothetical protein MUP47_01930 [Phycisphaerae bacterium]|nr:hypothetical protein [Phycisphaerae bacterium]
MPSGRSIRRAVQLYLRYAYSSSPPAEVADRIPPADFDPPQWLMGPHVERDPPNAPLERVRSFVLRLGNENYPHMKLRLSRPPRDRSFLFSVDCHDTFLSAPAGSSDYDVLEGLKRHNAIVAEAIRLAWEQSRLPTERVFLRRKITQAKKPQAAGRRRRRPRQ